MSTTIRRWCERRLRQIFAVLSPAWQDRARRIRIRVQRRTGRRRLARPVTIPGSGPVVLLNAIGVDWAETIEEVDRRSGLTERVVVVTDQPVMHLARELPIVVEYVPVHDGTVGSDALGAARLAEILRVYAVERIVDNFREPPGGSATVTQC